MVGLMDRLTDGVRGDSPRNMMFADDIIICNEDTVGYIQIQEKVGASGDAP